MKTEWDYTSLADAYLSRPNYSGLAIDAMLSVMKLKNGVACDIGAGVAHLTIELLEREFKVVAVEPNHAMRKNGVRRTEKYEDISWHEGTGESTGQDDDKFDLVTFGSSFNVCDRVKTLNECARILKRDGWFACMWNHRNLEDGIQKQIEAIIGDYIPNYNYGLRREDQTQVIENSGLFKKAIIISSVITHRQNTRDCIAAWDSHATLARQAGKSFKNVVQKIAQFLNSLDVEVIEIPYTTKIWISQIKSES